MSRRNRRWLAALLVISLAGSIHFLLHYRSEIVLDELVRRFSGGQYSVSTEDIDITYFPLSIRLEGFRLVPETEDPAILAASCNRLDLQVQSVVGLLFRRTLDLTTLIVEQPDIVLQRRQKADGQKANRSIADVQHQLFDLFDLLKAENVRIRDGALRINEGDRYFSINHIHFALDGFLLENKSGALIDPFQGNTSFELQRPDIHLPDSSVRVALHNLFLDKSSGNLQIDSFSMRFQDEALEDAGIQLASLSVNGFDWQQFLEKGSIQVDSIDVRTGITSLNLSRDSKKAKGTSKRRYSGPPIKIHHLGINDISYSLLTKEYMTKQTGTVRMNINGNRFEVFDLEVVPDDPRPVRVAEIDMQLKDYSENDSRNYYNVSLGSIKWTQNNLELKNYSLTPRSGSSVNPESKIIVPELRIEQLSLVDLFTKHIVADRLSIDRPEVVLDAPRKKSHARNLTVNEEIREWMSGVREKVSIGKLVVRNGQLRLQARDSLGSDIVISGVALQINAEKAVGSDDLYSLLQSIDEVRTESFRITGPEIDLKVEGFHWLEKKSGFRFDHLKGKAGQAEQLDLDGVEIVFRRPLRATDVLACSRISAESGNIRIKGKNTKRTNGAKPWITSDRIEMNNIGLEYVMPSHASLYSKLSLQLDGGAFGGQGATWKKLTIEGLDNLFASGKTRIEARDIWVDQPGSIRLVNVKGENESDRVRLAFRSDELRFGVTVSGTRALTPRLDSLSLIRPVLDVYLKNPIDSHPRGALPSLVVERLMVDDAEIRLHRLDSTNREVVSSLRINGHIALDSLGLDTLTGQPVLTVSSIVYDGTPLLSPLKNKGIHADHVHAELKRFQYFLKDKRWRSFVQTMTMNGLAYHFSDSTQDSLSVSIGNLHADCFQVSDSELADGKEWLSTHSWNLSEGKLYWSGRQSRVEIDGIRLRHDQSYAGGFDRMIYTNTGTRENFWSSVPFEKDFIRLVTGAGSWNRLDIDWSKDKPSLQAGTLTVEDVNLLTERDKTRPADTVSYRPLLANTIQRIPVPLILDTVLLKGGSVRYHEIGLRSGKEGKLLIDSLNGWIYNVRNHGFEANDTLTVRTHGSLYSQGEVRVNFRQSYTDSLQGFRMRIRLAHFSMPGMNALLEPLMNIRMKSGEIDTLTILVKGNDYFSFGTIDMRYHDLSVNVNRRKESGTDFFNNTMNWLLNQFIRSTDNGKPNLLFRRRIRSKGQFNYWGKIAVEGLLSNTGIKRDNAERKAFEKTLRTLELPDNYWAEE